MKKIDKVPRVFAALVVCLCLSIAKGYAQNVSPTKADDRTDSVVLAWLKDLYEPGVKVQGDSFSVNQETERLLSDPAYRALMYPTTYTWKMATGFIKRQELKKAFWYFINLYAIDDKNKKMVIKAIVTYDKIFKMDKVLESTFYTYGLTDPTIGSIENGHSEITAPHILDKKLNALKEMLYYLQKNRPADKQESAKSK